MEGAGNADRCVSRLWRLLRGACGQIAPFPPHRRTHTALHQQAPRVTEPARTSTTPPPRVSAPARPPPCPQEQRVVATKLATPPWKRRPTRNICSATTHRKVGLQTQSSLLTPATWSTPRVAARARQPAPAAHTRSACKRRVFHQFIRFICERKIELFGWRPQKHKMDQKATAFNGNGGGAECCCASRRHGARNP